MPQISIVSPVYRGEKIVHELVRRIVDNVSKLTSDFEIILVNDASPDKSWLAILKECDNDNRVKGINLSRNFGQHKAIRAGLTYAKGEWVVVMDCDLQDRPEEIPNFYAKAMEGYDVVQGERMERQDNWLKKFLSKFYHVIFDWLTGIKTNNKIAHFGIYKSDVIKQICRIEERDRGIGSLVRYVGFNTISIPIEHGARYEGKSSYTLKRMLNLAFNSIISNTNKPLRMMVAMGFAMAFISLMVAFYNVIAKLMGFISVAGFSTIVFSIWFVGGMLMMQMGILGIYIGKVFDQVKGRPLFVVRDEVNIE